MPERCHLGPLEHPPASIHKLATGGESSQRSSQRRCTWSWLCESVDALVGSSGLPLLCANTVDRDSISGESPVEILRQARRAWCKVGVKDGVEHPQAGSVSASESSDSLDWEASSPFVMQNG